MSSFWLGVLVGGIGVPLILALISKPAMKWFLKKQATQLTDNIMGRMQNLGDQFQDLNNEKEENDGNNETSKKEES